MPARQRARHKSDVGFNTAPASGAAGLERWSSPGRGMLLVPSSRCLFLTARVNTVIYSETDAQGRWGALPGQHHGNDSETKWLKSVATEQ